MKSKAKLLREEEKKPSFVISAAFGCAPPKKKMVGFYLCVYTCGTPGYPINSINEQPNNRFVVVSDGSSPPPSTIQFRYDEKGGGGNQM